MANERRAREDRYPIGRLFAVATARIEAAHEIAIAGQDPRQDGAGRRRLLRKLRRAIPRCEIALEKIGAALER